MSNYREYEVFVLNTSGIDYKAENCSDPHIVIDGVTIPLTPESLPKLYDLDVEYMERFVFSIPIPDAPVREDPAMMDWFENTMPTQIGRCILWENGWYAEDSVSLIRPIECAKRKRILRVLEKNNGLCLDTREERSKLAKILADEFEEITGHPV